MSTFVSVGNANQPFERLLTAVSAVGDVLPGPVIVQNGHTPFADDRFYCTGFVKQEKFDELVASAQVLITHGGAGSVITALAAGRVPIVMPRDPGLGEHVDHHQAEFVKQMASLGKVLLVRDEQELRVAVTGTAVTEHATGSGKSSHSEITQLIAADLAEIESTLAPTKSTGDIR